MGRRQRRHEGDSEARFKRPVTLTRFGKGKWRGVYVSGGASSCLYEALKGSANSTRTWGISGVSCQILTKYPNNRGHACHSGRVITGCNGAKYPLAAQYSHRFLPCRADDAAPSPNFSLATLAVFSVRRCGDSLELGWFAGMHSLGHKVACITWQPHQAQAAWNRTCVSCCRHMTSACVCLECLLSGRRVQM